MYMILHQVYYLILHMHCRADGASGKTDGRETAFGTQCIFFFDISKN